MPDEEPTDEETVKKRNQKKMLAALVRTGKHVYGRTQPNQGKRKRSK